MRCLLSNNQRSGIRAFTCLLSEYSRCLSFSGDPESVAGEYGRHSLYKMLGYFSLVGLLRLHSLLGDYYQAIKVLENIELNKKVMPVASGPSCQSQNMYF